MTRNDDVMSRDTSRAVSRRDMLRLAGCTAGVLCGARLMSMVAKPVPAFADVDLALDDEVSIYVGNNYTVRAVSESEGVVVVNNDLKCSMPAVPHLLAGWVIWGMMLPPTAAATILAVGGNVIHTGNIRSSYASGNIRIGGSVDGSTASQYGTYGVGPSTNTGLFVTTANSKPLFDWRWVINGSENCIAQAGLGRQRALMGVGNNGAVINYNDYWNRVVAPLISTLRGMPATGSWDVVNCPAYNHEVIVKADALSSTTTIYTNYDAKLVLRGDGVSNVQVIDLDLGSAIAKRSSLGKLQFATSFENMPNDDNSLIIIRVHGQNLTFNHGFKTWINGRDVMTSVNKPTSDPTFVAYRNLASRILWLYDDNVGSLRIDSGHAVFNGVDIYIPGDTLVDLNFATGNRRRCRFRQPYAW